MEKLGGYRNAMNALRVSREVRDRVLTIADRSSSVRRVRGRRLRLLAVVAAVLLLLAAGVMAGGAPGLQSYFERYWSAVFGREMSPEQKHLIQSMTQRLDLSRTLDEVTVSVDSAMVGDNTIYLLIRMRGPDFSRRYSYGFEQIVMECTPDLPGDRGVQGYTYQYKGLDNTGAAMLLVDMQTVSKQGFSTLGEPIRVKLSLYDLMRNSANREARRCLAEGVWTFEFKLDCSNVPEPEVLGDQVVQMYQINRQQYEEVKLTDIQLSGAGLRFSSQGQYYDWFSIRLHMKDGTEVSRGGGTGTLTPDRETTDYSMHWKVPVLLEQVEYLQFGQTMIKVS